MTARPRRSTAALPPPPQHLWLEAAAVRQEWLRYGLCTAPADRGSTEKHLRDIYARTGRTLPDVCWVDSPAQALPLVRGFPTLDRLYALITSARHLGAPPVASDVAVVASRLRTALSDGVGHSDPELVPARRTKRGEPWPERPPLEALAAGIPLGVVLHQGIRTALHRSLARGGAHLVRDALTHHGQLPVCWYGQQDAAWIAYYEALGRLGLARYRPEDVAHLETWAGLSRSCGWWWPGEEVCVVVERPETVVTGAVPGALHGEVRLRDVRYRDGWRPTLT